MANATITAFACTYDFCDSKPKGIMVCITDNTTPNPVNLMLYEKASDIQEVCSACTKNCTKWLCPQPHSPVPLPTTCSDDKLTQDSNNAALWMHNYYRKLLASGWAKDKKSKSGYAPPAKGMLALEYDCAKGTENGAKKTYELIKDCPTNTPSPTSGYSLNFLSLNNITVSEQDALEHAIKTWWGELETKGLGSNTMFDESSGITNFAHMAYDKVTKVACAVQRCPVPAKTLVACQYNPAITNGDNIYETGKVCSGCKKFGMKCSNPEGLCEKQP
ncbi:SCP-like protein [Ancylostoma caninum]|uniref:SCP-like protein n=1 Tax=Ancylostoma caninum TaxID=29170 RepID=A0A368G8D0_ANCCA|nr:SCP-like protein [Ancylostoma caninum]